MILWLALQSCMLLNEKPSVLLILTDGLRADRVGAYGSLPTDTPNIDNIAKKGTVFSRAYATSTLSGPARSSVLTGEVPPVHGHRLTDESSGISDRGWLASLVRQGWTRCDVDIDIDVSKKTGTELDKCLSVAGNVSVISVQGMRVSELDSAVGAVVAKWERLQPEGLGFIVGINGSMEGARADAALLITDDLVRVPLIVWGPKWEQGWEVSEVVSTVDVGATILTELGQPTSGLSLKVGGSDIAYHESVAGYRDYGARPLFGFTGPLGRYVEGVYGRWYPAGKTQVRAFEDPESEYAEHATRLKRFQEGFEQNVGLPSSALKITIDPSERIAVMSLVSKLDRVLERGQLDVADRIIERIAQKAPDAPILQDIRRRREGQGSLP